MLEAPLSLGSGRADTIPNVSVLSRPRGNLIAYWRERRQGKPGSPLTQKELGQLIERDPSLVGRYERGERYPSFEILFTIAAALEVPPHVLYPSLWRKKFATMRERRGKLGLGTALP